MGTVPMTMGVFFASSADFAVWQAARRLTNATTLKITSANATKTAQP